jgi:hypothetical protein
VTIVFSWCKGRLFDSGFDIGAFGDGMAQEFALDLIEGLVHKMFDWLVE